MLEENAEEKRCLSFLTAGKFLIFEGICFKEEETSPTPAPDLLGSMLERKSVGRGL